MSFYSPLLSYTIVLIFALIVGSFLNVVIYRLPKMLYRQWQAQCVSFLDEIANTDKGKSAINLCLPGSHCTHCKHALKAVNNIPLLSYLWQRGKCYFCGESIAWRYPVVELLSAVVALVLMAVYGWTWTLFFALIFSWSLLALIFIDLDEQLLPDQITIILIWLGLLVNTQHLFTDLTSAVLGAVAGYSILWLVAKTFWLVRRREGMGHGDFKLLAALGAWLGWVYLLPILLISSLVGAFVGITLIVTGKLQRQYPIPFGPFLAGAGWMCLVWGQTFLNYLGWGFLSN